MSRSTTPQKTTKTRTSARTWIMSLSGVFAVALIAIVFLGSGNDTTSVEAKHKTAELIRATYNVEVVSTDIKETPGSTITISEKGQSFTCELPERADVERGFPLSGCASTTP